MCMKPRSWTGEAESSGAMVRALNDEQPDLVVLDVKLGVTKEEERAGLELLPQIKKRWPDTEVIMLTGQGTVEMANEAGRRGAYTFLTKPFETGKLLADVKCALEHKEQNETKSALRNALATMRGDTAPVFRSAAMQEVVRTVERVGPSDVSILITGESGTGKEVIADLIHALSPRSKARIIKINCAALPRELIESDLRNAGGHPEQTPARAPGPGSPPGRRESQLQDQLPPGRGHQSQARGGHRRWQTPRGFVLSHQRDLGAPAAPARTARGHHAAGQHLFEAIRRPGRPRHQGLHPERDRAAHRV